MKHRLAVVAVLTLAAAMGAPGLSQAAAPPAPSKVPVLVYDRSGGFPPVPAVATLLVYGTGEAILTRFPASFGYCAATATSDQVAKLLAGLAAAGAFYLGDDLERPVGDLQDITVTFCVPIGGKGRARSNSFTFTAAAPGPYPAVEKIVEGFIAEVFPHC